MLMNVLVLNSGSSTLKFQLIATDLEHIDRDRDKRLSRGLMEGIGGQTTITLATGNPAKHVRKERISNLTGAVEFLVKWLVSEESGITEVRSAADIHAVGHRVVHGGEKFSESVVVTDQVLRDIEACTELAPLHTPGNVRCIKAVR
jgi:acetate kinase